MNSVFHSAGKNPFQLPPLPQSHYAPSPGKEYLDKSISLTPQKLKHRHEYSLPPEVYTPEQYSIHEDDSLSGKPPLPVRGEDNVILNLGDYLEEADTWDSGKFYEKWSSENFEVKDDGIQTLVASESAASGPLSSTIKSEKAKEVGGGMKDKPFRVQTSFASDGNPSAASDRAANIQKRLDRFRFGEPKAPEKRNARARLPTPSNTVTNKAVTPKKWGTTQKQVKSKDASPRKERTSFGGTPKPAVTTADSKSPRFSATRQKPPSRFDVPQSPEPVDASLSTLNSKLDRLIQESSAVTISPFSTLKSSFDKSSILKVSSDATTVSSESPLDYQVPHRDDREPVRTMSWQKENLSAGNVRGNRTECKESDILYQWRLRRKLEEARDHAERSLDNPSYRADFYRKAERPFAAEACRVLQDSTSVYGVHSQPSSPRKHQPCHHPPGYDSESQPTLDIVPPTYLNQCECPYAHQHSFVTRPRCEDARKETPHKRDVGVGVTETVTAETQTGQSLILLEVDPRSDGSSATTWQENLSGENSEKAPTKPNPNTSTPASNVSFHRVKIVEAESECSPKVTKQRGQTRNLSPASYRTEATTPWGSDDHKGTARQSPASSTQSTCLRSVSEGELRSPTANVVKQVVGSRLFNTSGATSRSSGGKSVRVDKRKTRFEERDHLNESYTSPGGTESVASNQNAGSEIPAAVEPDLSLTLKKARPIPESRAPEMEVINATKAPAVPEQSSPDQSDDTSETASEIASEGDSDFDPDEYFDRIVEDIESEPSLMSTDMLAQLKKGKAQVLIDFRRVFADVEQCEFQES